MSKIFILTNSAEGLYLFRKELLCALKSDGHTLLVSVPPDRYCQMLESLGCIIYTTAFERRGMNPLKDLGLMRKYRFFLRKEHPDIVLTYTIKPNIYGGWVCRSSHVPYICNITGLGTALENPGILSRILLFLYKHSMRKARCIFFQNERNRRFMNAHGIACGNYRMLPGSGVNLTEHPYMEYPSEDGGIKFLAVMRVMRDKGIEEYMEAARRIKERHPEVSFYLAGDYEEETRTRYETAVQAIDRQKIIHYLGHIDNVHEKMAQCHVIIHPSYHEGLSNVLLEAAACGRPVLASDVSGCIETFSEGESGFAFPAKNADALIAAIEKILALSFSERREMGITGRAWVEQNFDRNLIVEAYREAINDINTDRRLRG